MRPPEEVVLLHDPSCGDCRGIAGRAADLFRPPVTTRSCRDPGLYDEFPSLRDSPSLVDCGRPVLGVRRGDTVRWHTGPRLLVAGATMIRPGRIVAAVGVLLAVARAGRARVSR